MTTATDAILPAEADLAIVIPAFYARIRADTMLGPIFNEAVHDWPDHESRIVDFWSSVMLSSGKYKGNPVALHARHRDLLTPAMFDRWLAIWADVTSALIPQEAAQAMQVKAAMIAQSLQLSLFFRIPPERSKGQ